MLSKSLSGQTNSSKSFQSFFIETMELLLTHKGRLNFTQMVRCGRSCESRFRQNFKKAIDLFWSSCAAAMKRGLEILGISIVDTDANDAIFLKAKQTFTDKMRKARKVFFSTDINMSARDIFDVYRTRFQLEFVFAMPSSSPASLTVRRGTRRHCLSPSTLPSRPSTLSGSSHGSKKWIFPSLRQKLCCTMPQCWIDLLLCPGIPRTCDLITLVSKNFYSTAFALWCNFLKRTIVGGYMKIIMQKRILRKKSCAARGIADSPIEVGVI